jgi:hypothetical protein
MLVQFQLKGSRSPWSHAHHDIGTGEREAWYIAGNGREVLEGFWRQRRKLLSRHAAQGNLSERAVPNMKRNGARIAD